MAKGAQRPFAHVDLDPRHHLDPRHQEVAMTVSSEPTDQGGDAQDERASDPLVLNACPPLARCARRGRVQAQQVCPFGMLRE